MAEHIYECPRGWLAGKNTSVTRRRTVEGVFRKASVYRARQPCNWAFECFVPFTDDGVERLGAEPQRAMCFCPRIFDVRSTSIIARDIENTSQ